MINKIYKTIHNKFSTFFNFKIFLRYIFPIFFVAMVFFLIIPQFFDYKKKEEIIKLYLFENYGLQIKQMGEIEFRSFPFPNLKIEILIKLHQKHFSFQKHIIHTRKILNYGKII